MITKDILPLRCIKYQHAERKLMFSENDRIYTAENSECKEILGFQVDKGLIDDENERCDYSLIVQNDVCFLIELKGCNIAHAAEQILATQNIFQKKYGLTKFVARIVASKSKTAELNAHAYKKNGKNYENFESKVWNRLQSCRN